MRSPGLVFFKENRDPLNTRVFSPDTKTGVQTTTSTSVLPGLFKYSELQKEVTLKSHTTSYGSVSFPGLRVDGQQQPPIPSYGSVHNGYNRYLLTYFQ